MTRQDSITQVTGPFNEDLEMIRNQLRRGIKPHRLRVQKGA